MSRSCGGRLYGGSDALVAAAAADIAAHSAVDFFFRGVFVAGEQRGCLHNLTALAIAALRHIRGSPCLLHRMITVRVEPFDRYDRPAGDIAYGGDAGAGGFTVD